MEKGKCRIKMIMGFERIEEDGEFIYSPEGKQEGKKGDYVIKNPHGFSFIVDKDYFEENYEIIEEKEKEITMPEILAKNILENTIKKFIKEIISPSFGINDFIKMMSFKEEEEKDTPKESPMEGILKMDEKDIKNILPKGNYLFLSLDDYKRLTNLVPYKEEHTDKNQEVSRDTLEKLLKERIALRKRITELLTKNPSRIPSNIDFNLKVQKELIEEIKEIEKDLEKFKEEANEKM